MQILISSPPAPPLPASFSCPSPPALHSTNTHTHTHMYMQVVEFLSSEQRASFVSALLPFIPLSITGTLDLEVHFHHRFFAYMYI